MPPVVDREQVSAPQSASSAAEEADAVVDLALHLVDVDDGVGGPHVVGVARRPRRGRCARPARSGRTPRGRTRTCPARTRSAGCCGIDAAAASGRRGRGGSRRRRGRSRAGGRRAAPAHRRATRPGGRRAPGRRRASRRRPTARSRPGARSPERVARRAEPAPTPKPVRRPGRARRSSQRQVGRQGVTHGEVGLLGDELGRQRDDIRVIADEAIDRQVVGVGGVGVCGFGDGAHESTMWGRGHTALACARVARQ